MACGAAGGVWRCCWATADWTRKSYSAEVTFSSQSCRQGPPCLSMALLRIALTASWLKHGADPALNHYGIIHGRQWEGLNHSNGMFLTNSFNLISFLLFNHMPLGAQRKTTA